MKFLLAFTLASFFAAVLSQGLTAQPTFGAAVASAASARGERTAAVPLDQIGATAEKQYSGDGFSVAATEAGARLRCVFQKLQAEATSEGLWLASTVDDTFKDRFQVVATRVGRQNRCAEAGAREPQGIEPSPTLHAQRSHAPRLPNTGTVAVAGSIARFLRPGLIEEYSVSMDGVRQDFIIERRPEGEGDLWAELAVSGARVEQTTPGAQLVLKIAGRNIAYSRLRVMDATGKELPARMEVEQIAESRKRKGEIDQSLLTSAATTSDRLVVVVKDVGAVYPLRVDPTFSDANWISVGGIPSANGTVNSIVVDGSGNLYIGGSFTIGGDVFATNIAKWNGSSWAALGSGTIGPPGAPSYGGYVAALAVLGNDLYAGGAFTNAGGVPANLIAKWNGTAWSTLGSGMNDLVLALAVSGNDLYAGGRFTTAGGNEASCIAKWNGSSWSALGSGLGGGYAIVEALAMSGTNLYAGGWFTAAGANPTLYIAKWNGSAWSALGSGMGSAVFALALSGGDLYAGGDFHTAGGIAAERIAKWNGSAWSALGSGMVGTYPHYYVYALTALDSEVYSGGSFTNAGGVSANYIAKWNGSAWSALGSGMNDSVTALAVSGSDLYAAGQFTTAGGKLSAHVAKTRISSVAKSVVVTNSAASIQFSGVTGYQYDVQRATSINPPITWTTVTTSPLSPADDGSFTFTDTNAPLGMAYYRTVEH